MDHSQAVALTYVEVYTLRRHSLAPKWGSTASLGTPLPSRQVQGMRMVQNLVVLTKIAVLCFGRLPR